MLRACAETRKVNYYDPTCALALPRPFHIATGSESVEP